MWSLDEGCGALECDDGFSCEDYNLVRGLKFLPKNIFRNIQSIFMSSEWHFSWVDYKLVRGLKFLPKKFF